MGEFRFDKKVLRELERAGKVLETTRFKPTVSRGRGDRTIVSGAPVVGLRGRQGLFLKSGLSETLHNLSVFGETLTKNGAETLANIGAHLLSHTHPKVPFDTGELRASGRATLKFTPGTYMDVAKGTTGETIDVEFYGLKSKIIPRLQRIDLTVHYSKEGDMGLDIAVWTHEDLLYYYERPEKPAARQPGTGPKYLESTFVNYESEYIAWLENATSQNRVSSEIRKDMKVLQRGTSAYEVDVTKLRVS